MAKGYVIIAKVKRGKQWRKAAAWDGRRWSQTARVYLTKAEAEREVRVVDDAPRIEVLPESAWQPGLRDDHAEAEDSTRCAHNGQAKAPHFSAGQFTCPYCTAETFGEPVVLQVKGVDPEMVELEGPYECPFCCGHAMFDATFLDQVAEELICPYCKMPVLAPEPPEE